MILRRTWLCRGSMRVTEQGISTRVLLLAAVAALLSAACRPAVRAVEVRGSALQDGAALKSGDVIRPDESIEVRRGSLVMHIEGTGTVRAFDNTRLSVDAAHHGSSVRLALGRVWAIITEPLGRNGFEVRTGNAVAGVRGTELIVETENDDTEVRVIDGEVEVSSLAAPQAKTTVRARQRSTVHGQEAPSRPAPYRPRGDRGAWRRLTRQFKEVKEAAKDLVDVVEQSVKEAAPHIKEGLKKGGRRLKKGIEDFLDEP